MIPLLDREGFELLIAEERDFVVCFSQEGEVSPLVREVFERFAPKIIVLMCSPRSCPSVRKYLQLKVPEAILLFSGGRCIDLIHDLGNREEVLRKVDGFVRFSQMRERILLEERIFQRSRRKLRNIIEMRYQEVMR